MSTPRALRIGAVWTSIVWVVCFSFSDSYQDSAVTSALQQQRGIVVAIPRHMEEQFRLVFVHFWAKGDAINLANALRSALEKIAVARS